MSDVVVVGAGLAGLAAARRLTAAGCTVVVVEARDRVGGRTEAGELADGQWVELGGQWIGPTQDRMYELVDELGLATVRTYDDGDSIFGLLGQLGRISPGSGLPRLNPFAVADLAQGTTRWARLARTVDLERPWETERARQLDGETLRSWVRRNLRTAHGRAYFEVFCEAVFSADPSDLSALHALFYTRSGTDMNTLMSTRNGAQQDRIVGGSWRVSERMAAELDVRLSQPVRTVRQDEGGVLLTARDGTSYRADRVIITVPPTLAGRLEYDPVMPSWRDQLTQKLPAGSVIKVYAVYPTPFWRVDGLNGQAASDRGPVKVTFDNTPPGYERGILLGFIEADDGRRWARRTVAERRAAVVDCFVRYFGEQAADPLEYLERDWMAEEFSRGCYGAHFAPGVWTGFGDALRAPVGLLHWAGAECSPVWNGYMEGAVRSGEATADEVLSAM